METYSPQNINPDAHVLVVGNIIDGCEIYGPFDTGDDAVSYAESLVDIYSDWLVTPIKNVQCDARGDWVDADSE